MKTSTSKQCRNCDYFAAYFLKGACRFFRIDCGMCNKTQTIEEKDFCCEDWRRKSRLKRQILTPELIDNYLDDVREIKRYFEE